MFFCILPAKRLGAPEAACDQHYLSKLEAVARETRIVRGRHARGSVPVVLGYLGIGLAAAS